MQVGALVLAAFTLALVFALIVTTRRARTRAVVVRAERDPRPPTPVERRAFLNRALLGSLSMFAVAMGAGSAGFLWPTVRRGTYGGEIVAGRLTSILRELELTKRPIHNVVGKFYITRYEGKADEYYASQGVLAEGLMAISQKCSHLGCRVPYCPTSGWFECPCHGARFNEAGEVKNGPAPAGMWRHRIFVVAGEVIVDTSDRVAQPPMGFDSIGTPPRGAFCVDC